MLMHALGASKNYVPSNRSDEPFVHKKAPKCNPGNDGPIRHILRMIERPAILDMFYFNFFELIDALFRAFIAANSAKLHKTARKLFLMIFVMVAREGPDQDEIPIDDKAGFTQQAFYRFMLNVEHHWERKYRKDLGINMAKITNKHLLAIVNTLKNKGEAKAIGPLIPPLNEPFDPLACYRELVNAVNVESVKPDTPQAFAMYVIRIIVLGFPDRFSAWSGFVARSLNAQFGYEQFEIKSAVLSLKQSSGDDSEKKRMRKMFPVPTVEEIERMEMIAAATAATTVATPVAKSNALTPQQSPEPQSTTSLFSRFKFYWITSIGFILIITAALVLKVVFTRRAAKKLEQLEENADVDADDQEIEQYENDPEAESESPQA